jgi:ferritin-like metal-binding protein YciE
VAETELTARDAKLIQYLNEAYGKEKELETSLQAHIQMTTRAPYKKRLREHLRETKRHAKELERRIKQLGGKSAVLPAPGPEAVTEAAGTVLTAARKGMAAAKGPLHVLRGTGEQEKMLKNAKTEYWNEAEEIGTYNAIITFAESVGDRDTAKVARTILRDEERMSKFLARLIPQLAKAVVQDEVPASERRRDGAARRRTTRSTRRTASSNGRGAASRSGGSKTTASRSGRKSSTSRSGRSRTARAGGGRS